MGSEMSFNHYIEPGPGFSGCKEKSNDNMDEMLDKSNQSERCLNKRSERRMKIIKEKVENIVINSSKRSL